MRRSARRAQHASHQRDVRAGVRCRLVVVRVARVTAVVIGCLSFLLGCLGTVLSSDRADADRSDELEVRSVTGTGAGRTT